MKTNRTRRLVQAATTALAVYFTGALSSSSIAGNTWDGGGGDANWSTAANWDFDTLPGYGTLTFSGSTQTTNTVDANTSMNMLLWTGTSAWTLNNSGGAVISLYDNGGVQAKIENQSTGTVTINAPITYAATSGAAFGELNAVNGDIIFGGGDLTVNGSVVNGLKFWSGAGRTVIFNNTVSATGKWLATTGSGAITIGATGSVTAADIFVMNGGSLNLAGSLTSDATKGIRLGGDFGATGDQDLSKSGTLNLTPGSGGVSYGGIINTVGSNTSGALLVDSQNTSGTNTLSAAIVLDSNLTINQAAGGTLALTTGGIDLKSLTLTLTSGSGSNINASGVISNSSGSGSLVKGGAGTVTLSGNNTFGGGVAINEGNLLAGHNSALGAGTMYVGNGGPSFANTNATLLLNASGLTVTNALVTNKADTGGGFGTGIRTLGGNFTSGTSTFSGTLALNGGAVLTAGSGGTVNFTGIISNGSDTGNVSRALTINAAGGTVGVSNTNTYTGGTTLTAGTLSFANGSLGTTGAITMNGGSLQWATGNTQDISSRLTMVNAKAATFDTNGNAVTLATAFGGATTGSLVKTGAGALTLTGTNTYTGGTTVNGGTLKLGSATSLVTGGGISVASGATFDYNGQGIATTRNYNITIAGDGVAGVGAIINTGGPIYGNSSIGSITMAANSSVGGTGRWDIGDGGIGRTFTGGGFTLTKVGTNEIVFRPETVTGLAAINVNAGTWTYEGFSRTTAATSGMTNTVNTGGTLSSYGTLTFNMPLVFAGGGMTNNSATSTWTGTVAFNATTGINVNAQTITLQGTATGSGAVNRTGTGTLNLEGNWSGYSGTLTHSAGTTNLTGTASTIGGNWVVTNGDLLVNSTADQTLAGNLSSAGLTAQASFYKRGAGTLTLTGDNSAFLGTGSNNARIMIEGGVLSVSNIADSGTGSQLGNWTSGNLNHVAVSGGTLRYTGASSVTTGRNLWINSTAGTIEVTNAAANLSFNGTGGTVDRSVIKTGAGALTLGGVISAATGSVAVNAGTLNLTNINTYTGTTTITSGTLALTGATGAITGTTATTIATGGTLKIDNSSASVANRFGTGTITLTGGTLDYFHGGVAATNYSESLGTVVVNGTGSTVSTSQAATSQTSTITLGGIGYTSGSLNFSGTGLGVDARNKIVITGMGDGYLMSWATVNGSGTAIFSSTFGVTAASFTDVPFAGTISDSPTTNIRLTGGTYTGTPADYVLLGSATTTVNNILQNQTDATTIDNASKILRLGAAGGISLSSGMGSLTVGTTANSGTLTAGGAAATAGTVNLTNNDATSLLTINSVIADNGAIVGVATVGTGKVVLAGANTYTGTTVLGAATTEFSGGTQTLTGIISGGGVLLKSTSTGTLTLSGVNTYTGATNVNAGTLKLGNAAGLGSSSLVTVASGATLDLAGFGSARPVTLSGTGVGSVGALYNSSVAAGASVGAITLAADATVGGAGNTYASAINQTGVTLGANKLTLSNTYFRMDGSDAFSGTGNVELTNNAVLFFAAGGSGTATITAKSGTNIAMRDYNNTGLGTRPAVVLDGGSVSNGRINDGNGVTNGGGAQSVFANNITIAAGGGTLDANNTSHGKNLWFTGTLGGSGALLITGGRSVELYGDTSGYTGTATLSGSLPLIFAGASNQVFNGNLIGAGALTKNATNVLTLSGVNGYTGATVVTGGTLKLDYGTNDNRKIGTGALTLSGGTIELTGTSGTFADSVASTTLTALTNSTITRSSGAATLNLNAITRNSGALLNFAQSGIARTDTLNASGIIGNWATVGGTDWAVNSTNTADGLITASTYTLTSVALNTAANYTDVHISVDSNQSPVGAITPFTLRFNDAGAYTLTLTGTNTIKAGAILVTTNVGNNASALTGGILQTGTAGGDFAVIQNNSANTLTIGSVIQNNTSASTLTKGGSGTLSLTGINTYTGATTISGGTLQIGGAGQLNTGAYAGAITDNGTLRYSSSAAQTLSGIISGTGALVKDTAASTLLLNGANSYTGTTTISTGTVQVGDGTNNTATLGNNSTAAISSGATLAFYRNGAYTIGNAISGAGTLSFLGTGVSTQSDYAISGANTMTGAITVGSGARFGIDNATDVGTASGITVASGGQAYVSGGTIARPFTIAGIGWTEAAGQLGALRFSGGSTISGGVTLAGDARLTAYAGGDTGTISGIITDGASTFGLTKTGAGTITLSGTNTYDGVTTVSEGTIKMGNIQAFGNYITGRPVSQIVVSSGAMVDFNASGATYGYTIAGTGVGGIGALVNTSATAIGNSSAQTSNIKLSANATIGGTGNWALLTNSYTATTLDLGGFTLTKAGANTISLVSTTTTAGTIQVSAGSLAFGVSNGGTGVVGSASALVLANTSGVSLSLARDSSIGSLSGGGSTGGSVALGSFTLTVGDLNTNTTYAGVVSGTGTLTKVGSGTLTLTGANTYTGATTTLSSGGLTLDFSATGAPATNILNTTTNSSALSMGGGTLLLTGKASTTNSQRLNGLTVTGGSNTIQLTANVTANPLVLTLGAITRTGGTMDFILPTGTQSATNGITTSSSNDGTGILGSWATVNGTDFATVSSGNIIAYTGYVNVDARAGGSFPTINTGSGNVRINGDGVSGNIGLDSLTTTINTLLMGNATYASTVDTASKTLVTNAVMVGAGKQALTLGAAANDGALKVNASGGTLILNNQSATNALTVNAVIQNNTSASGLFKTGSGLLTLAGTNTYTGVTTIGGGVLATGLLANGSSNSGIGASTNVAANLVLANGTLRYTGNTVSIDRAFTISAGTTGTVDVATSGQELTISGVIAATTGSLVKSGAGILKLTAVNTYTGTTTVSNGILRAYAGNTATGAIGNSSAIIVNNGGTIEVGGDNSFTGSTSSATKTLTINSGGTVTCTTGSTNHLNAIVLNGGTLSATTAQVTYANWNFDQKVSTLGNGSTSTISGGNASLSQTGGTVFDIGATDTVNVSTVLAKVSGASDLGLIKQGAGTLNLSGVNTYLSNTTISAGTLKISGAGQLNSGSYAGTITDNSAFVYSSSATQTLSGVISGTGSLTKDTGAGVLTVSGTNTYTGTTTVSAGTLKVSNTSGMGTGTALTLSGGTLQLATDTTVGSKNLTVGGSSAITLDRATAGAGYATSFGALTFSDTYTLTVAKGGNVTSGTATLNFTGFPALGAAGKTAGFDIGAGAEVNISGGITGTQAFAKISKAGLGTLILSGNNDYWDPASSTGLVTVGAGTLELRHVNALGDGGTGVTSIALSMAANTTVRVAADSGQANNADLTLTGSNVTVIADRATTGAGITNQFDVLSIGAHTLNVTGGTNVTSGTTQVNFNSATLTGNATMNVTNPAAGTTNLLVSGVVGGGAFSLTKTGNGTLTLTGTNTYSGGTTITGGVLAFNSGSLGTTGTITMNGGTLRWNSTNTQDVSARIAMVAATTATFDTNGNNVTLATAIGGGTSGLLTKAGAGTLLLTGANNYTGLTSVNVGTLEVSGNSGSKMYTVAAGATLKLGYSTGDFDYGYGATINGSGVANASGLYIQGGKSLVMQNTLTLATAASTVRAYGTGSGTLRGWDINGTHLSVQSAASGSVIDTGVTLNGSQYGYRMNIASGANTATGDLIVNGVLAGSSNSGFYNFYKEGAGSILLNNSSPTYGTGIALREGSVILGGNNRMTITSAVLLGNSTTSGKLVLNGFNQTLGSIGTSGTGTANAIVGGSATASNLTINNATAVNFAGKIGGTGTNENNLALTKSGAGTLTISGTNTYTGATTVNAGKLVVSNNSAVGTGAIAVTGATSIVEISTGITLGATNDITVSHSSASVTRGVAANTGANTTDDYTVGTTGVFKSNFAGGTPDTTAVILAGTNSGSATTLTMSFSDTSVATNDAIRHSDVFTLNGTTGTDAYVLQLTAAGLGADTALGWMNGSNSWEWAVTGNTGSAGAYAGNYSMSFSSFLTTYGSFDSVTMLGAQGFDSSSGSFWAVIDHGGSFTAIPEPSGAMAGLLIGAGLLRRRRREPMIRS